MLKTYKDKQKIYKFLDDNKIKIGNHRIKIVEFKEIFNETWAKISRNLGPVPETDFEKLIRLLIAKEK